MKTLIIVPAYNEALNIKKAVENIKEETKYDYLVINDCSKDETRKVCEENGFNCISLPINYGLTSAIQLGMKYAYQKGYDIVIQFDGDGQHRAEYLKDLVEEIEKQECDIAIGSRFVKQKKTKSMRMLGSNLITLAIGITTGRKIKDSTSGMRAYNKKAIEEFVTNTSLTPEPDTLVYMLKKKFKIKEIQVQMKEREFGESYLKPLKSAEYMINMFFSIIFIRAITRKKKKEELI
jgi:glycosyltransferase involved in cell wall biosynthesis